MDNPGEKLTDNMDTVPRRIIDGTQINQIPRVYTESVLPIVKILSEAGYHDAALRLSRSCNEALLYGAKQEAVRAMAEKKLQDTDPELFAHSLNRPPEPEEE